ncbi:uncharacterized protein LOC127289347 [Leptopilina boulardi]|uniref:uncharacterized protein LOC127278047 n=1 Tax=Leptopilina boulardi TaxID=63433 RepID=UPI0021F5E1C5|nr:uncharacterized protein LOC127278047 [Leptopilina boulardi]XP_051155512.1 uncharacterized protein LOC127278047 [Leptopilina boulardi]XP_051155991.1 uncharacterized protein LOC127278343 [Leptopilina boulardi]XP_051155992.1 uncharacterized protein LOC127278343 [Leptopilina boulardi]XP_051173181.1 uncharacterized protein LOC127289347 [Leptopilina boulardi]XP_051173182.1 uncharacterized protein LOC127289347 [Leptopilina boulardi]
MAALPMNRRFECDYMNCNASFNNRSSLRSHKSRTHRNRVPLQNVDRNIVEQNNNLNDQNVIEDVQRDYVNPDLINDEQHLNSQSDVEYSSSGSEEDEAVELTDDDDQGDHDAGDDDTDEEVEQEPENLDPRQRAIGLLLLQLRTRTNISEEKINIILQSMQDVVKEFLTHSLQQVERVLVEQENIQLREIFNIEEHVENINFIGDFNTQQKRSRYFEKQFKVLMPKKRILGRRFIKHGSTNIGKDRPTKIKIDEMYFVPLSKVLRNFSQNPTFSYILENHIPKQDVLTSFRDGLKFQNQVWRHNNSHHSILLYTDEVDVCDALGSKSSGNQKFLMIYASSLNLHPMYRSALQHIYLVGIVRSRDVKLYGLNSILKHIVKDFKKIENGIQLADGTIITGSLFATIGDNPAQNAVCGCKESFGTTRHPCRFCLAHLSEIHNMVEEEESLLRTREKHDIQVSMIENAEGSAKEKLMSEYGINRRSVLNDLFFHHITEGAPPDIIHDLILGVLPRTMQQLCQNVIFKKISLDELNRRIASFDYGYSEVDKRPPPLKASHLVPGANIKLSAVEMWTLAHILPFLVQDLIEPDCPYFANYMTLLEITCIVFGHEISRGMVDVLGDLIADYLQTFTDLYGADSLIPKQHFMIHYPRLILYFGPLGTFMCLRPEANHQVFKRIVQGMRNYKNLPLTLSVRYQQRQALELQNPLTKEVKFGAKKLLLNYNLPFSHLFHEGELLCTASWVNVNGIKYIPRKCLLAIGYSNENEPQFATLEIILRYNEGPIFICKTIKTIELNMNLMAYEIAFQDKFKVLRPRDLKTHEVFHSHKFKNKSFVIVKRCFGVIF